MRVLAVLILLGTGLGLTVSVDANSIRAMRGKKLLVSLLKQKPWNKEHLKRVIKVSIDHSYELKYQEPGWEQRLLEIENDPDYIRYALRELRGLVTEVPLENTKIGKPLLWSVIAPDGSQHYFFATSRVATLNDFTRDAVVQLNVIVSMATTLVYGAEYGDVRKRIPASLARRGRASVVSNLHTLDAQTLALATNKGKRKKIVALENWIDRYLLELQAIELERDKIEEQNDIVFKGEEVHLDAIIDSFEKKFLSASHYINTDAEGLQRLGREMTERVELLDKRNLMWAEKIARNCRVGERCVVIVGYPHLTYDNENVSSIVSRVRDKGFIVELLD